MLTDMIRETFEKQTGLKMLSIHQCKSTMKNNYTEDFVNNGVYKIETDTRPYIFKVYKEEWPKEGKIPFVYRKLDEYRIPHAEIIIFSRNDENFKDGYLIEECLPGITASRLHLSTDETTDIYRKLAVMMSQVHRIENVGFGYSEFGDNCSVSDQTVFSEFAYEWLNEFAVDLVSQNIISADDFNLVRRQIREQTKICDGLPSVLCHGDLSAKNMLVDSGRVVLIDWDDAHALCWMDDIAHLTFMMKLEYGAEAAEIYRKAFLETYETEYGKELYDKAEDILHVKFGLDLLSFFAGKPQYFGIRRELLKSLEKCGLAVKIK
ncbi:MAG: aminoglycoside phosphotransferase family protein [Clostridiales bacterium]|jgi:aminoglycoside phosphotransferase|nr:aminoglycoside phosphotransferase family protein [Clostridiales bacterium]